MVHSDDDWAVPCLAHGVEDVGGRRCRDTCHWRTLMVRTAQSSDSHSKPVAHAYVHVLSTCLMYCKLLPLSSLHSPSCPELIRTGPQEGTSGLCEYVRCQCSYQGFLLTVSSSRASHFHCARSCCVAICQDREWLPVTNAILFALLPTSHLASSTLCFCTSTVPM